MKMFMRKLYNLMPMKISYLLFVFLIASSCCSNKTKSESEMDVANNTKKQNALFEIIHSSSYGGKDTFDYLVVENSMDLNQELGQLGLSTELPELNPFNFDDKAVLFLYLGQKNTGGYTITVEKVEKTNEEVVIYSKQIGPKSGENVTMALTNPFCIAIIPKAKEYTIK